VHVSNPRFDQILNSRAYEVVVSSCSISLLQEDDVNFKDWVDESELSPSSAAKYVGAIRGSLTQWALQNNITSQSIDQIRDPAEFANVTRLLSKTDEFVERNARGNHMYSSALKSYGRYLDALNSSSFPQQILETPSATEIKVAEAAADAEPEFMPNDEVDARRKTVRDVVHRQGQPKFRKALVDAYHGRCAITGCSTLCTLQAAHVTPYLGKHTNVVSNGFLLRADIHTLWDLHLLAVDPTTMKIVLSTKIVETEYTSLVGRTPFQPADPKSRLSMNAIEKQWDLFRAEAGI
jgi:hypothetical protein